ncbi:TPA: Gfo/Idh/MocA family oxidoreductase [Candidatus Poribacteria bacterium]|nr:Gfo/Idh/MocA family oxidoreductase [Candidatus Poribacteria bacterium]
MALFKVGIIGCGGRGNAHAAGYSASSDAKLVACADPVSERAEALAQKHNMEKTYSDYKEMLDILDLDIVSVCTWTPLHTEMIIAAALSGVKAIHSEKPMAPTWGEAKVQYQTCEDNNVQLTFCHQSRFSAPCVKAKQLANDGTIGQLHRLEGYTSNLIDTGTHSFDMMFFFNNEEPAEWVMGQIHCTEERSIFDVPVENHGLSYFKWKNDVYGLLITGGDTGGRSRYRLIGSDGIIEIGAPDAPQVRCMHKESKGWEAVDLSGVVKEGEATTLGIFDLIDCLKTGREPVLSGRKALQATELIFATYESSRRRERIYLPLEIEDSPLISMIEAGMIGSKRQQ